MSIDYERLNAESWDLEIVACHPFPDVVKSEHPALFPIVNSKWYMIAGLCSLVALTEADVDQLQQWQDDGVIISYCCHQRKHVETHPRKW